MIELDPMLSPLQSNGTSALTHLPLPGSPAINSGDNTAVPADLLLDQRGAPFTRIFDVTVDLGAVELQPLPDLIFCSSFAEEPDPSCQ